MTLQPVPGQSAGTDRASPPTADSTAACATVESLAARIGLPGAPAIIDIRVDADYALDPRLIPGSRRLRHDALDTWGARYCARSAIVVCHRGLKLSQGLAALMRCRGLDAIALEGGFQAWADAGLPAIDADRVPVRGARGATRWVTRERPKIDRIACPWLIRRFVDPDAEFLFVGATEVLAVAERFGATPFDMPEAFWGHRDDRCTFDTMLTEFGLHSDALQRMAQIIRAADTGHPEGTPQSGGLLAIAKGFSSLYPDDLAQLSASMGLYDALYRWCRDEEADADTGKGLA